MTGAGVLEVLAVGRDGGGNDGSAEILGDRGMAVGVRGGASENAIMASAETVDGWGRGDVKILCAKAA